jgi:hypothetical protein
MFATTICQGSACSSYATESSCPENRCTWYSDDGTSFECTNKVQSQQRQRGRRGGGGWQTHAWDGIGAQVCGDYYDQELCLAANLSCEWDDPQYGGDGVARAGCDGVFVDTRFFSFVPATRVTSTRASPVTRTWNAPAL